MCYSAMVQQHLRSLARDFRAQVDWEMFEEILSRRVGERDIKVSRALESNFGASRASAEPQGEIERRAHEHIEAYRRRTAETVEQDIFKQRRRLADAQRALALKETKRARDEQRIAQSKIDAALARLADLKRTAPTEEDNRIFPMYYAPVLLEEEGRRLVRPMRYMCRLPDKPASYDARYPGTYNARRDNLRGFWSELYGRRHAIMVITSFFENVPSDLYEKRALRPGEKARNVVVHFNPQPPVEMLVACLWSRWTGPRSAGREEPALLSFAAITDDPPPEIAATGHNRCVIPLKREHLEEWLAPERTTLDRLDEILDDRYRPFYEHRVAA